MHTQLACVCGLEGVLLLIVANITATQRFSCLLAWIELTAVKHMGSAAMLKMSELSVLSF